MSYSDYEEIQVTDQAPQVHCLTQQGWRLIEISHTGEVSSGYQQAATPGGQCPGCHSYHSGDSVNISGSVVLNKAIYVLGLKKDAVVMELRENLDTVNDFVKSQKNHIEKLNRDFERLEEELDSSKGDVKALHDRITRQDEDLKKTRILEGHLQKAKKLVGDRDWRKEVLGEDE